MRTDMRNSVCLPHIAYPTVEGQILMRRCNVRIVVDFFRILTKATRRLHGYENIAVHRSRHQDIAVIFHNGTWRFAPVLHQLLLHLFIHQGKELFIFCSLQLVGSINLLFRQHAAVIGGIGCQLFDKFLRILRNPINLIATLAHSSQHATDAFDCIKANGTADIGITRRIVVENNSNFFLAVGLVAQHRPLLRLGGHALYTLHIRQIADIAVFQNFFVCYRHAVNNTIKFRQRNADGNLHGVHAFKAVLPFLKGRNCRIGSQNRYVKLFQIIKINRTAGSHGKLHDIQQHIDCRHTVCRTEEAVENLRQTGHAHFLKRHAVAENADSVDALCFQLLYHRSLVGQIAPHPFVAVKKNARCRTAADAKITLVFR